MSNLAMMMGLSSGAGGTPWLADLSVASYDSVSFTFGSELAYPNGVKFNNDGTKMYVADYGFDIILQYSLSSAYDMSSASYDSVSFNVSSQEADVRNLVFNSDGTKMYIVGSSSDTVYQYSLSTAYDMSSASYDSVSFSVSGQETNPYGINMNNDGTKMYIIGASSDKVNQYSLSTAYDLSTASYDSVSFSVADTNPKDVAFSNDGTKMYVLGDTNDTVYQYTLSTEFDVGTASYDSVSFSTASQTIRPRGLVFNADGSKMYITSETSPAVIYQYSTA